MRFAVDFAAGAAVSRTKLLLYSPSNPLGWVATVDEQRQLLDFCRRHGLWLMADEVYEPLLRRPRGALHPAPVHARRRSSWSVLFSKTYCMTGWRLGWLVSRADLCHKAAQLNEFIVSHAASMTPRR
ncbi:MAG: aminotransferase class I/II-fold pyridoxal phosphate-dependent enzyme [Caldilineaceae bacterium]